MIFKKVDGHDEILAVLDMQGMLLESLMGVCQ
jgi:hypothetical protein